MIHRTQGRAGEAGRMVIRNSDDGKPYKIVVNPKTKVRAPEYNPWMRAEWSRSDFGFSPYHANTDLKDGRR